MHHQTTFGIENRLGIHAKEKPQKNLNLNLGLACVAELFLVLKVA
jgi:hypothetical protein